MFQINCRLRTRVKGLKTEPRRSAHRSPERLIFRVKRDWDGHVIGIGHASGAAEMIEVSMGEPDRSDAPTTVFRSPGDQIARPGRIDHHGLIPTDLANEVTVGDGHTQFKGDDFVLPQLVNLLSQQDLQRFYALPDGYPLR